MTQIAVNASLFIYFSQLKLYQVIKPSPTPSLQASHVPPWCSFVLLSENEK